MQQFSKKDFSILFGNVFDHFNSSLYSFVAPVLAPIYFPKYDTTLQLILAYSILGSSVVSRPIGSYLFSVLAHNKGPTFSLSYSLIGAALFSIILSLLPDYSEIGIFAPLGLLILNFLNSIFASGENAVAQTYILENKEYKVAYKASYIYQASSMLGIILASFAGILVSSYGGSSWRLCYIIGGTVGFIGYYLRNGNFTETNQSISYNKLKLKDLWLDKAIILSIAIVTGFSYLTYSVTFIIMNNYVPLVSEISVVTMMKYNSLLLIVDLMLLPIIGKITQKYNYKKIMLCSSLTFAALIVPLWQNLAGSSLLYVCCVRFFIIVCGVAFACPINLWCKKITQSSNQYLIISMGSTLGSATIGRLSPAICLFLWYYTQSSLSIALYIIFIALSAAWIIINTNKNL